MEISGLATTAVPNTKIREVEDKIPSVTNLVASTVLDTKIKKLRIKFLILTSDVGRKYFTTSFTNLFTMNFQMTYLIQK